MKKMAEIGGQWRLIRHYLSMTNLNQEVERLLQRMKPASPEQWDNLIKKFEKAVNLKFSSSKQYDVVENSKPGTARLPPGNTVNTTSTTKKGERKAPASTPNENEISQEKVYADSLTIGSDPKEITFENILQGLRLKKDLHFGKITDQKWKSSRPVVSKNSIHSRTAYVISAIVTAESKECLIKRTEQFIDHLKQYPEARDYAIKEGGIRALLRVQNKLDVQVEPLDEELNGGVKEALALLGYTGPSRGPGPNILSIDGGGMRGIIALEILRHLERLTGRRVHDMFDYIVGVSTGAMIAAVIASGVADLDGARDMYYKLSKQMFGGTSLIGGTSRLVWSHGYYDTDAWEKLLQDNLNGLKLTQCNRRNTPKVALVSCVVNSGSRLTPFLFRSYEMPFRVRSVFPGTSDAYVWQAVRASAAAPTYFQEFKHNGLLHQDGGIMVNNPSGVGLHEVRLLFGAKALQNACMISIGTGRALNKHHDFDNITTGLNNTKDSEVTGTSWKDKFKKILDSATDTEGVHLVLNDLLPPGGYYRLNPPLMEECAMDEINDDKLNQLRIDTQAYIRRNQQKFESAALMLTRKRSVLQRVEDLIQRQGHIMGVMDAK